MPCTTVTNFCSEGKVMLLLSMVRYQVLLCFRHTRYGQLSINKLCKLNFRYFTMYLATYKSAAELSGLFKYGVYFFFTLVH